MEIYLSNIFENEYVKVVYIQPAVVWMSNYEYILRNMNLNTGISNNKMAIFNMIYSEMQHQKQMKMIVEHLREVSCYPAEEPLDDYGLILKNLNWKTWILNNGNFMEHNNT